MLTSMGGSPCPLLGRLVKKKEFDGLLLGFWKFEMPGPNYGCQQKDNGEDKRETRWLLVLFSDLGAHP